MRHLKRPDTYDGIDVVAVQSRLQSNFNRYKASVAVSRLDTGILVKVTTLPRMKIPFTQIKEMFIKVDRFIDGYYSDIFEVRASWVEVNADKGFNFVIDYGFEGEN